jgi:hypothetical protein
MILQSNSNDGIELPLNFYGVMVMTRMMVVTLHNTSCDVKDDGSCVTN